MTTEIDAEGLEAVRRAALDRGVYLAPDTITTIVAAYLATTRTSEAEPVAWHWWAKDASSTWPVWIMQARRPDQAPDDAIALYDKPLPTPASDDQVEAVRDVLAERKRQISVEGWTPEHDDEHRGGSLAIAAACYAAGDALPTEQRSFGNRDLGTVPALWPRSWAYTWWKPKDRRRNLVKAGALILAEIERLDRLAAIGSTKP